MIQPAYSTQCPHLPGSSPQTEEIAPEVSTQVSTETHGIQSGGIQAGIHGNSLNLRQLRTTSEWLMARDNTHIGTRYEPRYEPLRV